MLGIGINCLLAMFASRITAVRHVEVVGGRAYDQGRIDGILSELRGVPYSHIHAHAIETEVLREPSVLAANFSRSPFGNGRLSIEYRKPIAKLTGLDHVALDKDGVVYRAPDMPTGMLPLTITNGGPPTMLSVAGDWRPRDMAALVTSSRAFASFGDVSIQVDERGVVCLNIGSGRVVLGACANIDEKLKVLQQRLAANRDELSQVKELNLSEPKKPAFTPLETTSATSTKIHPRKPRRSHKVKPPITDPATTDPDPGGDNEQ